MYKFCVKVVILFLEFVLCYGQRTGYNETCNSTEECSDHRYKCQLDQENVLRCLCDRFHAWFEDEGCVQLYNASEILNMTVTVTDNIRYLEEHVNVVMRTQLAAGLFVFGMVIVATLIVTGFCVYVHIKDRSLSNLTKAAKKEAESRRRSTRFDDPKPSTSTTIV
ncbi:hypothetical protein Zmor_027138 [Zophobas morio]|uniref:EGF-like domain-containing protein n=2 Tax=Zophobas morio TaxID=2755281 RepID=A0AA38M319_9CUCU|nr:hypothetical protein Zmor_027138 [Zophobas morio]